MSLIEGYTFTNEKYIGKIHIVNTGYCEIVCELCPPKRRTEKVKGEFWKNFNFFCKKVLTNGSGSGILIELSPRGGVETEDLKKFFGKTEKRA